MYERTGRKINITAFMIITSVIALALTTAGCSDSNEPARVTADKAMQRSAPLIELDSTKLLSMQDLNIDLNDPLAMASRGDQFFESGNYPQAIELYKKTLELKPDDVDTFNDLGLAYFYTRKPVMAVDTLKKGTEADPSFQRIWISLGFVLSSSGRIEEAKSALGKAVEINPDNEIGQESKRMIDSLK
jgi:tetratricopeptide (TPR) repeat protein